MTGVGPMVRIRRAGPADLDAINRIHNAEIRATVFPGEEREKTAEERQEWFRRHGDSHPVLVAEDGSEVVGWVCLSPWSEFTAHHGTVEHSLYVADGRRGRGIGRLLLAAIIAEARRLGYHCLVARVASANAVSLGLHAAAGFRTVGVMREVACVRGELFDEVVLQLIFPENHPDGLRSAVTPAGGTCGGSP
jgi:L-amino acid N-acyltransferase